MRAFADRARDALELRRIARVGEIDIVAAPGPEARERGAELAGANDGDLHASTLADLRVDRFRTAQQRGQVRCVEHARRAGGEPTQRVRADGDADQAERRVPYGRGHAPDLPVAPFGDAQLEPAVGHRLAHADRRLTRWQGRWLDQPGLRRAGALAREHDALA